MNFLIIAQEPYDLLAMARQQWLIILLIEDKMPEYALYIKGQIRKFYRWERQLNGEAGLQLAIKGLRQDL